MILFMVGSHFLGKKLQHVPGLGLKSATWPRFVLKSATCEREVISVPYWAEV